MTHCFCGGEGRGVTGVELLKLCHLLQPHVICQHSDCHAYPPTHGYLVSIHSILSTMHALYTLFHLLNVQLCLTGPIRVVCSMYNHKKGRPGNANMTLDKLVS